MSKNNKELPPHLRKMLASDVARAHELTERGQHEEARTLARRVRSACAMHGVSSAHVTWLVAVLSDYLGELDTAYEHIMEALRLDPLDANILRSLDVICDRIRAAFMEPTGPLGEHAAAKLYSMLLDGERADREVHLQMATLLEANGQTDAAMKILDALCVLDPVAFEVWTAKAALARRLGKAEEADTAEAEARSCGAPVPSLFGVPGTKAVA